MIIIPEMMIIEPVEPSRAAADRREDTQHGPSDLEDEVDVWPGGEKTIGKPWGKPWEKGCSTQQNAI